MSKQEVHFDVLGYQPMRMKPVHFANGFFLSLLEQYYDLEMLNKTAIIKNNKGLLEDYAIENLLTILKNNDCVNELMSENDLKLLRIQINGIIDNDDGAHAAFKPYSAFGNDYSLVSSSMVTSQKQMDGYAGHFLHQILTRSSSGKKVIEFACECISQINTPIAQFLGPLLEDENSSKPWVNHYIRDFGDLTDQRMDQISQLMEDQTNALSTLCCNLKSDYSHQTKLRSLIICLCAWLFLYMQKVNNDDKNTLFFMDFLGGNNNRLRIHSRNSFTRQRELFFSSYQRLWDNKKLTCEEKDFDALKVTKFKFLEEHFSDLAVRIGFAQPRAARALRKHFELQPDTARILVMSVIKPQEVCILSSLSENLRNIWGICFGGCEDDQRYLNNEGYMGLDQDEDLEPNCDAFTNLLMRLNIAIVPSDGLVLCAANPEEFL